MTGATPPSVDRGRQLLMAALDGELSNAEQQELNALRHRHPELDAEASQLSKVKEVTQMMALRQPSHEIWTTYWTHVYNRLERGIGWVLVSVGAIVIAGYSLWKIVSVLLEDQAVPWFLKVAVVSLLLGIAILLISVMREKLFVRSRDRYKEVSQ